MSNKTLVRIGCFTAAVLFAMLGVLLYNTRRMNHYRRQVEYSYTKSLQEVSSQLNEISVDLWKTGYAGSSAQISALSAKVWKSAGTAKSALGNLPVENGRLEEIYHFLSQVGDYTMYLSRKSLLGEELTAEEQENLERITAYARELNEGISDLEYQISTGQTTLEEWLETAPESQALAVSADTGKEGQPDGYPTLIYDGPFSDHLMEKSPALIQGQPEIAVAEARDIAADYAGVAPGELTDGSPESSKMPSYSFCGDQLEVGVTKQGGYVTYLVSGREIGAEQIEIGQARSLAREYLEKHEIGALRETYYELSGGILTINYAYSPGDVLCYTDLIKVGVAMDNGAVVFYDARGFISNNKERTLEEPTLSAGEAARALSKNLRPQSVRLALIPTSGGDEALTYEFRCKGKQEEDVLVYINAYSGAEQEILILIKSENGTLTV